jgi:hypothetical protein
VELKALADISERFIEHYEQFEVLVGDMCEDADASLWTEDMRFWFNHAVDKLVETKLETALNTKSDDGRYDGKAYDRIKRELLSSKISVKQKYQNQIPEVRLLELATLRLIAGAILAYGDPLRDYHRALESGVLEILTPSSKAQKAAKTLLEELKDQGLHLQTEHDALLDRIAFGEHPYSQPQLIENKKLSIKNLVREVSVLSKQLFIIENQKENRFPVKSIQRILDIVSSKASDRTIANHQSLFDDSKKLALSGDSFI